MALQIRRGTEAQRLSLSGVNLPVAGEPLFTTDTKKLFIGDGATTGGVSLGYYGSVEVSGQGTLSASNNTDILTLVAGRNIEITTDPSTDSITINAAATFTELQNESLRIFQNNILGLNSNENINIDPAGTGKVVVSGTIESNLVQTSELTVGTFDVTPTNYYFESEGPSIERVFRAGGPGALVSAELAAYYPSPTNGQTGLKLKFRQSTSSSLNQVVGVIYPVVTDVTAGDSKFEFQVLSSDSIVVGGAVTGSGFLGNLTGNVTGNAAGDHTGTFTGAITATGILDGDVTGSVFADNSTLLVDGVGGILRGTHVGIFETANLKIDNNTISTFTSNQNLNIELLGTGALVVKDKIISARLELYQDPTISGITLANSTTTNANLVIANTHASASTSPAFVTNPTGFSGAQTGASMVFLRAKGTDLLDPQTVSLNDEIATMDFLGFYLPESNFYTAAKIKSVVDGTPGSNTVPGRLELLTTDSSGNSAIRLTVSSSAVSATVPFKLPVVADDSARSTLVPSPAKGMMIFMESGTAPSATNVAQVFDGSNWVNL